MQDEAFCVGQAAEGWDGEVIGGSRHPWNIPSAPSGQPAKGTHLYCIVGYLPGSAEEGLLNAIRGAQGSIFRCDGHDIFQTSSVKFVHGGSWNSFVNTDVFVTMWKQVRDNGNYRHYDWTVKVDPDTVFMPDRLRWHLAQQRVPADMPVYIKNAHGVEEFLGAIEVVSKNRQHRRLPQDNGRRVRRRRLHPWLLRHGRSRLHAERRHLNVFQHDGVHEHWQSRLPPPQVSRRLDELFQADGRPLISVSAPRGSRRLHELISSTRRRRRAFACMSF